MIPLSLQPGLLHPQKGLACERPHLKSKGVLGPSNLASKKPSLLLSRYARMQNESIYSFHNPYQPAPDEAIVRLSWLRRAYSAHSRTYSIRDGFDYEIPFYVSIALQDPGAALACARRDIEIRIRRISQQVAIQGRRDVFCNDLVTELMRAKVITSSFALQLKKVLKVLNRATHGETCDPDCLIWLKWDLPELLHKLDQL